MAMWTGEEIAEGLERWLKTRRDEYRYREGPNGADDVNAKNRYVAVDALLDEVRDASLEGRMVWDGDND